MIREALQLIQETAQRAHGVEKLGPTADGRAELFRVGGELVERPVPPANRNHVVFALADLITYADALDTPDNAVAWLSPDGVVLVLDDADRRDRVEFLLSFFPEFDALRGLEESPRLFDQRAFCTFCVQSLGLDKAVVLPFRRLDWNTQISARGNVEHGKDRLGREISDQVSGASELPELLQVPTPVFDQAGEHFEVVVPCHVDLKPADQRIALVPVVGEIRRAIEAAMVDLRTRLSAALPEGVALYYGRP